MLFIFKGTSLRAVITFYSAKCFSAVCPLKLYATSYASIVTVRPNSIKIFHFSTNSNTNPCFRYYACLCTLYSQSTSLPKSALVHKILYSSPRKLTCFMSIARAVKCSQLGVSDGPVIQVEGTRIEPGKKKRI